MVTPPAPVSSRRWKGPRPLRRASTKTRLSTRSKGSVKEVLGSVTAEEPRWTAANESAHEKETRRPANNNPKLRMTGSFPSLTGKWADSDAERGCIAGAAERQRGYTESYPTAAPFRGAAATKANSR